MAASGYCKLLLLLPTKIGFQGKKTMLIGKTGICRDRSSRPEVFLVIGVLKICNKLTGEHLCRSVISIKLQSNFIEIILLHGCSPVLLHIFRTPFSRNTSGWLLLQGIKVTSVIRGDKFLCYNEVWGK